MLVVHHALFMCGVFTLLCASLDSSRFVAIVRIRSSTLGSASSVRLLHGLVLLPCGISGKMTATLDLTTIIAMLVASFYHLLRYLSPVYQAIPNCHEPLTFDTLPSKPLLGYVTALLSTLIALLVAGEVEDCSLVDRILVGISQYLLYY